MVSMVASLNNFTRHPFNVIFHVFPSLDDQFAVFDEIGAPILINPSNKDLRRMEKTQFLHHTLLYEYPSIQQLFNRLPILQVNAFSSPQNCENAIVKGRFYLLNLFLVFGDFVDLILSIGFGSDGLDFDFGIGDAFLQTPDIVSRQSIPSIKSILHGNQNVPLSL